MADNSVADLKNFFSDSSRECKLAEFQEFWKSLTDEEKAYYKAADLS